MKKTIGVLAHVDAGKTTFSEQVLYHTNSIRKRGRVDHKDSFLDSHSIEKERGITVFSDQGIFELNNSTYYLVDTPGHVDFCTEMERAIMIMDYAIVIISAIEGVQAHTKTVWRLLRKYNVPTFIFVNKLDRVGADTTKVLNQIKRELNENVCYVEAIQNDEGYKVEFNHELIEFVSEHDDNLLEMYLEEKYDENLWHTKLKELIKDNKVFPVFKGSALNDEGVLEFLYGIDEFTYTNYGNSNNYERYISTLEIQEYEKSCDNKINNDSFIGYVYKIRHDDNGNRLTFVKVLNGELKVKDEVNYGTNKEDEVVEKINALRVYNGNKFKIIDVAKAGELAALTGITNAACGDMLGILKSKSSYEMVPTLVSKVIFDNSYNVKDVLSYFKILESEDPALNITWNDNLSEIQVHIMGKIQLEVLKEVVKDRFSIDVEFGPCKILYKETIEGETTGCGHFEPLKHYAEVHLKIEEGKRNSGIIFENKCHVDNLSIGYQKLIKSHIFEREHHGILTGSSITDLKITLLNGRAHLKHTCGGDFREATFRAIRQGLEKAQNVLLEPYYRFKIEASKEHLGRILSDIQRFSGTFDSPEDYNDNIIVTGRGPVSTFMDYPLEIVAFTKGKGSISFIYDGYDVCHNSEEVIEEINYNKNADREYTSNSVFCSHGKGYTVPWDEADEAMHVQD